MLVLSRKRDERVVCTLPTDLEALAQLAGETISLTVVRFGPGQIRLGFDAPRAISIDRGELLDRVGPRLNPSIAR
ncbi:MAG: carbon storage regulator [Actinomycetota bacterium]